MLVCTARIGLALALTVSLSLGWQTRVAAEPTQAPPTSAGTPNTTLDGHAPSPEAAVDPTPAPPALDDPVAAAERDCRPEVMCPHFAALVRLLGDVQAAPRVLQLLSRLADARAAQPIASAAVYGADAKLREAATRALADLARSQQGHAAVTRIAHNDPDPALRQVAEAALAHAPRAPSRADAQSNRTQSQRLVYGATALSRDPGNAAWTAYNLGFHTLDYTFNEHVEAGVGLVLPIAVFGVAPRVKLTAHPSDSVHLGVTATGGAFGTYVDSGGAWFAGGGPIVTIGDSKLLFNASALFIAAGPYSNFKDDNDSAVVWLALPSIGFGAQLTRLIRANAELYAPLGPDVRNGRIWALIYGIRLCGGTLFGDISFVLPIYPDAGDLLKYIPLGIPLLSFGAQW